MKSALLSLALILAQFPLPAFAGGFVESPADAPETSMAVGPTDIAPVANLGADLNAADLGSLSAGADIALPNAAADMPSAATARPAQSAAQARTVSESAPEAAVEAVAAPMAARAMARPTQKSAVKAVTRRQAAAANKKAVASKKAAKKSKRNAKKALSALQQLRSMAASEGARAGRRAVLAGLIKSDSRFWGYNAHETVDVSRFKLGRRTSKPDARTLQFQKYAGQVPDAPGQADFSGPVTKLGMMLNDQIGDCAVAAPGHCVQIWTANAGNEKTIPDSAILKAYEAPSVGNYNPNDPSSDQGSEIIDVLKYWRKTGIGGDKLGAFLQLSQGNLDLFKKAVWLFGGGDLGIALPKSAQKQVSEGLWDVPAEGTSGDGAPGSWGGHSVAVAGFDAQGVLIVTWGRFLKMTWAFFNAYVEESWAVVSKDFLNAQGVTPNNQFDWATLKADLSALSQNERTKIDTGHHQPKPKRG
ncbi:MAG: hypothetical protein KGL04_02265 [Elusimicrobia bacterium]|nr:hypothetical protein [Elusimicrobiota bacterium]